MSLALLLLAAAGIVALGGGSLRLLGVRAANRTLQLGLAIAAGLALAMLVLYAPLALGGRVHSWPLSATCAAALIAELVHLARGRATLPGARTLLGWTVVVLMLGFFARQSAFSSYDERAIYGLKAKALLCERDVRGTIFQEPTSVHFHRDYALGLPLLMAWTAEVAHGVPDDPRGVASAGAQEWVARYGAVEVYALLAVLWAWGLLLLAWGWLEALELQPAARAALVSLALPLALVVPWVGGRSWSWAGADIPLALLAGGAATALRAGWGMPGIRWSSLCALLLAAGILLKQDAFLTLGAAAAALLASRKGMRTVALAAALSCVASALVALVRREIPEPLLADRYLESLMTRSPTIYLARVPLLAERVVAVLESQEMLAFWAGALLLGVPLGWQRGGWSRAIAVWVAGHTTLTLAAFLVTPHNLDWHVSTALPRVLCHAGLPAGVLLVCATVEIVQRALAAASREPPRAPAQ